MKTFEKVQIFVEKIFIQRTPEIVRLRLGVSAINNDKKLRLN